MSTEIYLPPTSEPVVVPHLFIVNAAEYRFPVPWRSMDADADADETLDHLFSPWCLSMGKRAFDLACVIPALILLSPILAAVAVAVRVTSSGPVIFRQKRAGQHRKLFTIYKFRTMVENSEAIGPLHTAKGDPRITPIGNFLRRFKLDEFPQLYNVLRGDMSLVGPRPKLPHHEHTSMTCRPGVTGAATLAFCNEQHILSEVPVERLEMFYMERVVPLKIQLDADYMRRATLYSDFMILLSTILKSGKQLTHEDLLISATRSFTSGTAHSRLVAEIAGD